MAPATTSLFSHARLFTRNNDLWNIRPVGAPSVQQVNVIELQSFAFHLRGSSSKKLRKASKCPRVGYHFKLAQLLCTSRLKLEHLCRSPTQDTHDDAMLLWLSPNAAVQRPHDAAKRAAPICHGPLQLQAAGTPTAASRSYP
jgi:hypothetical protein